LWLQSDSRDEEYRDDPSDEGDARDQEAKARNNPQDLEMLERVVLCVGEGRGREEVGESRDF
jgi:hypothetical protein